MTDLVFLDALLNGCLACVGVLIALLILEGALRISDIIHTREPSIAWVNGDGLAAYAPNTDRMVPPEDPDDGTLVHNLVNAQGFVGATDFVIGKAPGVIRIAALGDSFTAALGVNTESNFVSLLDEKLGTGHEVLNFGVGGQGTVEQMFRYGKTVGAYRPDVVILFFFPNDLENNQYYLPFESQLSGEQWLNTPPSHANNNVPRTDLKFHILSMSRLLQLLDRSVRSNATLESIAVKVGLHHAGALGVAEYGIHPATLMYEVPLPEAHERVYGFTGRIIALLKERVEEDDGTLALVYLPEGLQVDAPLWEEDRQIIRALNDHEWNLDQPNEYLASVAVGLGIPYLDLTPAFRAYLESHEGEHLHARRVGHFNQRGHDIVAESPVPFVNDILNE